MTTYNTDLPNKAQSVPKIDFGIRPLIVDYSLTRINQIATGNYDSDNRCFTEENFPSLIKGEGRVEFEAGYIHSENNMTSDRGVILIGEADRQNPWLPAGIEHVLAFGATYQGELSKSPILGLGAVGKINGVRHAVGLLRFPQSPWREGNLMSLDRIKFPRHLAPAPWTSIWQSDTRLLVIRRVKK